MPARRATMSVFDHSRGTASLSKAIAKTQTAVSENFRKLDRDVIVNMTRAGNWAWIDRFDQKEYAFKTVSGFLLSTDQSGISELHLSRRVA